MSAGCELCSRVYVSRPLNDFVIAGRSFTLCGRCVKKMMHLVEVLAARRLRIVAVDQTEFPLDVYEREVARPRRNGRARARF